MSSRSTPSKSRSRRERVAGSTMTTRSARRSAKAGGSSSSQPRPQDGGDVSGPPTLGIDFGCTNSVVAILHDGDVEVIPNDIGARTTPSVVHVVLADPDAEQGSPRRALSEEKHVGEAALRLAVTDSDKTVRNVKCLLGRTMDTGAPFLKHTGSVRLIKIQVNNAIGILFKDQHGYDHSCIAAEEIAADILHVLHKSARSMHGETDWRAVLAVPCYFNAAQRLALKDAATLAGLEVVRLVNETSAAALAYAHGREGAKKVVVVDIGGGGGSVCVAHVEDDRVTVLAASPDRLPGGEDFDHLMVQEFLRLIEQDHQKKVQDPCSLEILRSSWEEVKQTLSRIPTTSMNTHLQGIKFEYNVIVQRENFEFICNSLFLKIIDGIKATLTCSKVPVHEVDDVVLVGGSSRIPRLRTLVQEAFGGKALCKAINPDEAVAKGATLLGSGCVKLTDILTLPTEVQFSSSGPRTQISRQTSIPCCVGRRACDFMTGSFTVRQTVDGRSEVVLLQKDSCVGQLTVDISGLFEFNIPKGPYYPPTSIPIPYGCLTEERRNICRRRLSIQRQAQGEEMKRVQSKNTLENILREVLSEPRYKDSEDAASLLEDCKRLLEKLLETPEIHLQESASHLENVKQRRTVLNNALAEAAAKARLQETRTGLRQQPEADAETKRQDFMRSLDGKASDLFNRISQLDGGSSNLLTQCQRICSWIQENPEAPLAEIETHFNDAMNLEEVWGEGRRKEMEKIALEGKLDQSKALLGQVDEDQDDWVQRFSSIVNDTSQWLTAKSEDMTANECQEKLSRLSKEFCLFAKDLLKQTKVAKEVLHKKLLDCLAKVPDSSKLGKDLRETCAEEIAWLNNGQGLSYIELTKRLKHISEQFTAGVRAQKQMQRESTVSKLNDRSDEILRRKLQSVSASERALVLIHEAALPRVAEAECIRVLQEAHHTGVMVLIAGLATASSSSGDKKCRCAGGRELVYLAVRFVLDADPVERLLAVREASATTGQDLLRRFEELCDKAGVVWKGVLYGVSVANSAVCREFLEQIRWKDSTVKEVWNRAHRLVERVAQECYSEKWGMEFFGVLDELREIFLKDIWFHVLQKFCPSVEMEPMSSYEQMVHLLETDLIGVQKALSNVVSLDVKMYVRVKTLQGALRGADFRRDLLVFAKLLNDMASTAQVLTFPDDLDTSAVDSCLQSLAFAGNEEMVAECVEALSTNNFVFPSDEEAIHSIVKRVGGILKHCTAMCQLPLLTLHWLKGGNVPQLFLGEEVPDDEHALTTEAEVSQFPSAAGQVLKNISQDKSPNLYRRLMCLLAQPLIPVPHQTLSAADQVHSQLHLASAYPSGFLEPALILLSSPKKSDLTEIVVKCVARCNAVIDSIKDL